MSCRESGRYIDWVIVGEEGRENGWALYFVALIEK